MKIESDQTKLDAEERAKATSVSYLDQALWRHLASAKDIDQFSSAWLALQCAMIAGCERGLVVRKDEQQFLPAGYWPTGEERSRELAVATERALKESRGIVHRPAAESGSRAYIAYPVIIDDEIQTIVAVEVEYRTDVQLRSVMRQLQWGACWFEVFYRRALPGQISERNENLGTVLKLVATSLDHEGFTSAITALATELSISLGCERVSVGFVDNRHMRVQAISHSAQFDKKSNLVRLIGFAMDEARDQLQVVVYPKLDNGKFQVTNVHEKLVKIAATASAATLLIANGDEIVGAITLEHQDESFFTDDRIRLLKQIALLVGPILELERRDDRTLLHKAADAFKDFGKKLLGENYLVAKFTAAALGSTIVYLALSVGEYRVSADATLEGSIQRHISAPIDGYVASAFARAGDVVSEGDALFALDDKDLLLERLKWRSQRLQVEQKYRDALVKHDKAEASIQKAQLDQARAQIQLIDLQLSRTKAVAPFAGVIVSGDLSQKLGAPVRKGEILLKVAPLDSYRLILDVDELDIAQLSQHQTGELSLFSLPDETFPFVVEKITPVSIAAEGRNTFRVEASLLEQSDKLRPGMQGSGKVLIGERSQLWIWTHSFFDWLRIWWWSLSP